MLLERLGARLWLSLIMMAWGLISTATMFIRDANEFYVARFLLGAIEAGFFPGVILYLTYWYTERYRARITAMFMSAIPLSGVVSGAVSGWILARMSQVGGLHGWQWLFLIEGLPPFFIGILTYMFLSSRPQDARWLRPEQKELLARLLSSEERTKPADHYSLAFKSPAVWWLCAIFFGLVTASYGISFWLPQILSETLSRNPLRLGLLSTIPWGTGVIAMIAVGRHSDFVRERRWHLAVSGFVAALGFALSAMPQVPPGLGLLSLSIATGGVMAAIATFWSIPPGLLS